MLAKFKTYQMSLDLFDQCQNLKLPHYMKIQLERAALSICLNLSEGNARQSIREKHRFFNIAYASNREVQTILFIARAQHLLDLANQIGGCIYTICRNLNRQR